METQSRPSTSSERRFSDPTDPLHLFDIQLKFCDSILSFFQERKRIEELYSESLLKLHRKIKSLESFSDLRTEMSTSRSVWNEVRDNTEREAQARQAFISVIMDEIIKPLNALKETQERTRKRIKEDAKESEHAYSEYAEVTLPKLKSKYTRRFSEVEEQKKTAFLPSNSPALPSSGPADPNSARPIVTAPQPLRPVERRPSNSAPATRNRSPSSGTAFSDLAHQGKKQLNQLMGFLDKSSTVKDGLGGKDNQALRNVRSKRELDEADREYRKGVHWLETLRLRRTKTLESGYTSLISFVEESGGLLKKLLEKYTDNMVATTSTETQLAIHARSLVDKISPEKDVVIISNSIPRSLDSVLPERVLYQHGQVGDCKDLIFGFSLLDYSTSKNLQEGQIPRIVRLCIEEIDQRGLESEGIYRVSGRHSNVQILQREIEKDEAKFEFSSKDDLYVIASLLKLYLRELPEPLFKYSLQDRIQHTEDFSDHHTNNFRLLRSKMRRLPAVHQATLKALVEHLSRVAALSDKNKMDAKNLAIVFGAVIFGEDELPKGADLLSVQTWKDSLMEDMITHCRTIFSEPGSNNSPPLPPTPLGEPVPNVAYGSRSTKVSNYNEDFTPKLPPRPASSIHPSARSQSSPTKDRREIPASPPSELRTLDEEVPPSPSLSSTATDPEEELDDRNSPISELLSPAIPSKSLSIPVIPSLSAIGEDADPPPPPSRQG